MSYTPRIIASYQDMVTPQNLKLLEDWYDTDTTDGWAMAEIQKAVQNNDYLTLKGVKLTVFVTDLSSQNEALREALDDMDIEYTVDN